MGNGLEVHCCCCQVKFGGKPKTPKKKNEGSYLLDNNNNNTTAANAAMANSFTPNPTVDISQFNQNNTPDFYAQYAQPYQNLGITDLRQPPPNMQNIGANNMGANMTGYNTGSTVVTKHAHSSSYDSFASSGIQNIQNNDANMAGLVPSKVDANQEARRSTVADPFSNDETEDDTTDLDSDFSAKSGQKSTQAQSKRASNASIDKILQAQANTDKMTVDKNTNNLKYTGSNKNNMTKPVPNVGGGKLHSNQNSTHIMSDGIFSTDVDNEENILSATDLDEEDKMLRDQSSDQQGGAGSNVEDDHPRRDSTKIVSLSGVEESGDDNKTQNLDNTQPPLKGSKMSKTVGHTDGTTGSDSDAGASALIRAQTQSNWTDQKLQDLEDEMRYEFEKLQMMQEQSDMIARATSGSLVATRGRGPSGAPINPINPMASTQSVGSLASMNSMGSMGRLQQMPSVMESNLEKMQSQMEQMLNEQKAQLATSGASGVSQADDTTDFHDDGTEYSDDDEIAQMKAKMKEMAQANQGANFGQM